MITTNFHLEPILKTFSILRIDSFPIKHARSVTLDDEDVIDCEPILNYLTIIETIIINTQKNQS